MKYIKTIINILLITNILIGFFSFFGIDILSSMSKKYNIELPLVDAEGIAVDSMNNIYIGSPFYGILQIYDKTGKFIKNWEVLTYGGGFYIKILKNDTIAIYPYRAKEEILYNKEGKLLIKNKLEKCNDINKLNNIYLSNTGERYEVFKWFYPKIKKDNITIISQNLLLKMLTPPQGFLIAIILTIFLVIININKINRILMTKK